MKRANILYYEPTSGFGGSSRCLLLWLKNLDKQKYNAMVAVHFNGPAIQEIKKLGIETVNIPYKQLFPENNFPMFAYLILLLNFIIFYIPVTLFLRKIISKHKISVVHLNAKVIAVIPGIIAAHMGRTPCICHLHDIKKPVRRERFFARWIDCFIVLTETARKLYEKEYRGKRIELICNGIDLDSYRITTNVDKLKQEFGIEAIDKIVGIVGRLVEGKGFQDFLNAAKIISSKMVNIKFMIVGSAMGQDKAYENNLKHLVGKLNLEQKVFFTGWREDVREIMSIFDVLVQASSTFREGFPLVCIEGMAENKPLVVTNIPGPSEIVIDGVTGYIIPPSNPERLAEAIIKIISDESLARAMGVEGRKRVVEYFDINKIVDKIQSIYKILIKGKTFDG